MECVIHNGRCLECGETAGRSKCRAEVPLSEYYKMVSGEIKPRPVELSMHQSRLIHSGPGMQLKKILESLGQGPGHGCNCDQMVTKMNAWGAEGCETTHRQEILDHLKKAYAALELMDKLKIARKAIEAGVWINPITPAESLLDQAIAKSRELRAGAANQARLSGAQLAP